MNDKIRIAVVDDHPLLREGVIHTLDSEDDIDVVAEGASSDDARRIAYDNSPEIILLDLSMPGNSLDAVSEIARKFPEIKIVILTVAEDEETIRESITKGASGYILKGISGPDLVGAIRSVYSGETYVTPKLATRLILNSNTKNSANSSASAELQLSHREVQILELLMNGDSNKEIGNSLMIAEKTVKHYMTSILQKLSLRNRVEAAIWARKNLAP